MLELAMHGLGEGPSHEIDDPDGLLYRVRDLVCVDHAPGESWVLANHWGRDRWSKVTHEPLLETEVGPEERFFGSADVAIIAIQHWQRHHGGVPSAVLADVDLASGPDTAIRSLLSLVQGLTPPR
jgi:hypothetical protein